MHPPRLGLIISTFDRPEALAKVLAGVERQTQAPDEVLISDDGSKEPTLALVRKWGATQPFRVQHVWHEHKGFHKTVILNKTVAETTAEYLIFLDGDCVPDARYLQDHRKLADRECWVQGRRCFVKEPFVPQFEAGRVPVWRWMLAGRITGAAKGIRLPFPIVQRNTAQRGIIGCNLAVWRDDLIAINGFDEEYSGWGIGEDSDMGTRLYHLGRRRKFVYAHAVVFHLNHPAAPKDHVTGSLQRLEETIRSRKVRCAHGLDQYLSRR